MYGNLVATFETSCTTSGWYYGGINRCRSSAGHPKDATSRLKGGPLGRFPPNELLLGESLGCPPSSGWWSKSLGT